MALKEVRDPSVLRVDLREAQSPVELRKVLSPMNLSHSVFSAAYSQPLHVGVPDCFSGNRSFSSLFLCCCVQFNSGFILYGGLSQTIYLVGVVIKMQMHPVTCMVQ